MRYVLGVVVSLFLNACGCEVADVHCEGGAVEICNEHNQWETFQSCTSVGMTCTESAARCGGYTDVACCD